jgi:hypothetical protein
MGQDNRIGRIYRMEQIMEQEGTEEKQKCCPQITQMFADQIADQVAD